MDPALRWPLPALADPADDKPATLEVYSLRQYAQLEKSQARTKQAVQAVDDCNDVNTKLAAALAPKKAWWHVW